MCRYIGAVEEGECDYCKKEFWNDSAGAYQYGEYRICEKCMVQHGFTYPELAQLRVGNLKMPRSNSIVKFAPDEIYEGHLTIFRQKGLNLGETYLFIGEIRQMPGHCIVTDKNGKTIWGVHTENFVELEGDEI